MSDWRPQYPNYFVDPKTLRGARQEHAPGWARLKPEFEWRGEDVEGVYDPIKRFEAELRKDEVP
jgi:hypothetical protein